MAQSGWGDTGEPLPQLEKVDQDVNWVKCKNWCVLEVHFVAEKISVLPAGSTVVSAEGGATSFWSQTARVYTRLSNGDEKTYFIKLTQGPVGKLMTKGEFESMKALHDAAPHMVPQPVGYGTFSTNVDTHFILLDFLPLHEGLPPREQFCRQIAELHPNNMEHSPSGKFGFHVITCNGTVQ